MDLPAAATPAAAGHLVVAQFSPAGKKGERSNVAARTTKARSAMPSPLPLTEAFVVAGFAQSPPYASRGISNSASAVDAFVQAVLGTVTDPPAPLNTAPGGQVTEPAGGENAGGEDFDAVFLRLQR